MNIFQTIVIVLAILAVNMLTNKYSSRIQTFYKDIINFKLMYQDTKSFFWKNITILTGLICIDLFLLWSLFHVIWW